MNDELDGKVAIVTGAAGVFGRESALGRRKVQLSNLRGGLDARSYRPGRLGSADVEGTVRDFYRYMARRLG